MITRRLAIFSWSLMLCCIGGPPISAQVLLHEAQELQPPGGEGYTHFFGRAVAVDGNVIAVGARTDDLSSSEVGAVYVFERETEASGWVHVATLQSPNPGAERYFGSRGLAIAGDVIFANECGDGVEDGAVYAYQRNSDGEWAYSRTIIDDVADDERGFGARLVTDGELLLVASPGFGDEGPWSVHVFGRNHGGTNAWGRETILEYPISGNPNLFGDSIAIEGDTIVVGQRNWGQSPHTGAIFIFERASGDWDFIQQVRTPTDTSNFGYRVAIKGNRILASDSVETTWAFDRSNQAAQWELSQVIPSPNGTPHDFFGVDLWMGGNLAVMGRWKGIQTNETRSGDGFIFARQDGDWVPVARYEPSNGTDWDYFGLHLAVSGDTLVVGAEGVQSDGRSGSVYVFDISGVEAPPLNLGGMNLRRGEHVAGGETRIEAGDRELLKVDSEFQSGGGGDTGAPHAVQFDVKFVGGDHAAESMHLWLDSRLSESGGAMKVLLRDWQERNYVEVGQFPLGRAHKLLHVGDLDPGRFVNAQSGRVAVRVKLTMMAPLNPDGFRAFIDLVRIGIR